MAHDLAVWLFNHPIGTLSLVDGRLSFCYRADWLAAPQAIALSRSLPLQTEAFVAFTKKIFVRHWGWYQK